MVRIRLQRHGRKNRPYYRLVAADGRKARNGRALEILGTYDPIQTDPEKVVTLKEDRVRHWLSVGAQPSETAESILKKHGIALPWKVRAAEKRTVEIAERRKTKPKKVVVRKPKKADAKVAEDVDSTSKKARREAKRLT